LRYMHRHGAAGARAGIGMPTGASRLHTNNPPPTGGSTYSSRAGGPVMGRRSSGNANSRGVGRNGQHTGGSGSGGGGTFSSAVGGPPGTAASMRSGAGSDRRHHDGVSPAGQWSHNHGNNRRQQQPGPPGTGGSASARHTQPQGQGQGQVGAGVSIDRSGRPVQEGGAAAAPAGVVEMPWGAVPEPAPLPKSPPIPTHRNKARNPTTDGGFGEASGPGPPKPGGGAPKPGGGAPKPPAADSGSGAGGGDEGSGDRMVSTPSPGPGPSQVVEQT
jgi:hypothetical protein